MNFISSSQLTEKILFLFGMMILMMIKKFTFSNPSCYLLQEQDAWEIPEGTTSNGQGLWIVVPYPEVQNLVHQPSIKLAAATKVLCVTLLEFPAPDTIPESSCMVAPTPALPREFRYGGHQTSIDTDPAGLKIRAGIQGSWKPWQLGGQWGRLLKLNGVMGEESMSDLDCSTQLRRGVGVREAYSQPDPELGREKRPSQIILIWKKVCSLTGADRRHQALFMEDPRALPTIREEALGTFRSGVTYMFKLWFCNLKNVCLKSIKRQTLKHPPQYARRTEDKYAIRRTVLLKGYPPSVQNLWGSSRFSREPMFPKALLTELGLDTCISL